MVRFVFACALILMAACAPGDIKEQVFVSGLDNLELNLSEHNVKTYASTLLQSYNSCEQLASQLKATALAEVRTRLAMMVDDVPYGWVDDGLEMSPGLPNMGGAVPMPAAPVAGSAPVSMPVEGIDFSGTNNQEKGVDEADIIKTDGRFFYILNRSRLEILRIQDQGELAPASEVILQQPGEGILLIGDKALVISSKGWQRIVRSEQNNGNVESSEPARTNVVHIDVIELGADRSQPQITDTYYFQGEFLAGRRIGQNIHLATYLDNSIGLNYYPHVGWDFHQQTPEERTRLWAEAISRAQAENEAAINGLNFLDLLPTRLTKEDNGYIRQPLTDGDCARAFGALDGSANGFLSLITLPNEEMDANMATQWVRGNQPTVYASPDQFILASEEHQPWWFMGKDHEREYTSIHRFKFGEDDKPHYADSTRVPGYLHNSFSLSEYQGYVRVATTTGRQRFWRSSLGNEIEQENHLFVLGDEGAGLEIISGLTGIAPGEKIWSARFSKDKGFLVTFRQVDPLFTLDLSDPKNPRVAGELKVPGVSTYLQDIGDGQLLAIGYGGDESGLDFQTSVSIFDVSDFANPRLADSLSFAPRNGLDHSWTTVSSEANSNHLAINYFAPLGMTAIPLNTSRYIYNPLDPWGNQREYITKLVIVNTAVDRDLAIYGEVDHSQYYNRCSYDGRPQIRRSYFVGDYVYAISPNVVTATRISDMSTTGVHELN